MMRLLPSLVKVQVGLVVVLLLLHVVLLDGRLSLGEPDNFFKVETRSIYWFVHILRLSDTNLKRNNKSHLSLDESIFKTRLNLCL